MRRPASSDAARGVSGWRGMEPVEVPFAGTAVFGHFAPLSYRMREYPEMRCHKEILSCFKKLMGVLCRRDILYGAGFGLRGRSEGTMNGKIEEEIMRPEYDFSRGVRGKHYQAYRRGTTVVHLKTDRHMETNDE